MTQFDVVTQMQRSIFLWGQPCLMLFLSISEI